MTKPANRREERNSVDLEAALRDPGSVFSRPEDVAASAALSGPEKLDILRAWASDLIQAEKADDEGMPVQREAPPPARRHQEVENQIARLQRSLAADRREE